MAKSLYRIRRRAFISGLLSTIGLGTVPSMGGCAQESNFEPIDEVIGGNALRDRAVAKGLIYGATTQQSYLSSDFAFSESFAQECGILVPEGELKWRTLRPSIDRFNFAPADWMLSYTNQHGMKFRGHTLVWHESIPDWFNSKVTKLNAEQVLLDHISTVVGHYAGKIHSWDVVNEVIFPPDGRTDGLRNSPWLKLLGPDYIKIAFNAAARADPQALLVLNEFKIDSASREDETKRNATLRLLENLRSDSIPIHAVGIQAHWSARLTRLEPRKLKTFLKELADLGLKIMITEMDVADYRLPAQIENRDQIVASVYGDYLNVVLEEPAVIAVLTWGLSDRYTWLSRRRPREDGLPVRPLPLDSQLRRKLAWNAIARAFDNCPSRVNS